MSADSDDRLVKLYEERREMLTRYLTARLGNREEAEDAVQEVFLKLHRAGNQPADRGRRARPGFGGNHMVAYRGNT